MFLGGFGCVIFIFTDIGVHNQKSLETTDLKAATDSPALKNILISKGARQDVQFMLR
jgi:hypothetical protein